MPRKKKAPTKPPAADGYYHKYFRYEGKRYHVTGSTEDEAILKAAQLKQGLEEGATRLNSKTTVKRWSEEWLATYKEGNITEKSLQTYRQKLDGYILPVIGDMKLKDVRETHLQKILNEQRWMSFSHVSKLRMVMNQMFKRAVSTRLISFNPAENLVLPDCEKKSHRALYPLDRQGVLKACELHRAGPWVKMVLFCGLRPGETAALLWKDIDFKKAVVHVSSAKESGSDNIKEPKTEAGIRDVPVRPDYLNELRELKRGKGPFDFVFTQTDGRTPQTDTSLHYMWRGFKRVVDIEMAKILLQQIAEEPNKSRRQMLASQLESELPVAEILRRVESGNLSPTFKNRRVIHGEPAEQFAELVPYCLRHTFCTDLQRAGVSLNVAKYLMGHADVSVTANIYTHATEDVVQDAGEKIKALAGF
ncbi:MAG: site-specific integrase [Clostridiales bacterium]|nr:site-specific integrase [Clostridiales bacterium]